MVVMGHRKFAFLVAPELLIWHFLVLVQHQIQQFKQNLKNLNYLYGYFLVTHDWPHLKQLFPTLVRKRKYWKRFEDVHEKLEFWFYRKIPFTILTNSFSSLISSICHSSIRPNSLSGTDNPYCFVSFFLDWDFFFYIANYIVWLEYNFFSSEFCCTLFTLYILSLLLLLVNQFKLEVKLWG